MSDSSQQNLEKTNNRGQSPASKVTQFKPGFDSRRWVKGRGKKSPEQREGEAILRAVIWEELSREFEIILGPDGKERIVPVEKEEKIDALRLQVRQQIKKDWRSIQDRIAGKVTERMDVTSGGEKLPDESAIYDRLMAKIQKRMADDEAAGTKNISAIPE